MGDAVSAFLVFHLAFTAFTVWHLATRVHPAQSVVVVVAIVILLVPLLAGGLYWAAYGLNWLIQRPATSARRNGSG